MFSLDQRGHRNIRKIMLCQHHRKNDRAVPPRLRQVPHMDDRCRPGRQARRKEPDGRWINATHLTNKMCRGTRFKSGFGVNTSGSPHWFALPVRLQGDNACFGCLRTLRWCKRISPLLSPTHTAMDPRNYPWAPTAHELLADMLLLYSSHRKATASALHAVPKVRVDSR